MKVMYLDESGDHSLDKIDPSYPMFVLGGVIVERTYARTVIDPRLRDLKDAFFGRDDIILHTADLVRAKNGFEALKDSALRAAFYDALNAMMRELEYTVVACAIKKDEHLAQYGANADDPYMYSLRVVVERFCKDLGNTPDGDSSALRGAAPISIGSSIRHGRVSSDTEPASSRRGTSTSGSSTSASRTRPSTLPACNSPIWSSRRSGGR